MDRQIIRKTRGKGAGRDNGGHFQRRGRWKQLHPGSPELAWERTNAHVVGKEGTGKMNAHNVDSSKGGGKFTTWQTQTEGAGVPY